MYRNLLTWHKALQKEFFGDDSKADRFVDKMQRKFLRFYVYLVYFVKLSAYCFPLNLYQQGPRH